MTEEEWVALGLHISLSQELFSFNSTAYDYFVVESYGNSFTVTGCSDIGGAIYTEFLGYFTTREEAELVSMTLTLANPR